MSNKKCARKSERTIRISCGRKNVFGSFTELSSPSSVENVRLLNKVQPPTYRCNTTPLEARFRRVSDTSSADHSCGGCGGNRGGGASPCSDNRPRSHDDHEAGEGPLEACLVQVPAERRERARVEM